MKNTSYATHTAKNSVKGTIKRFLSVRKITFIFAATNEIDTYSMILLYISLCLESQEEHNKDVVLGPWLSFRSKTESLVLVLALKVQSSVLALALNRPTSSPWS